MSHELKEGTKLKRIVGIPDLSEEATLFVVGEKGRSSVKDITVSEQPGQMSMVPWARVEYHDGDVFLVNLANVELVELDTQEQEA